MFWAGTIPYFSDRYTVDLLGKADKHVARLSVDPDNAYIQGHNKFDFTYSLVAYSPDIVVSNVAEPGLRVVGLDAFDPGTFDQRQSGAYSFSVKLFKNDIFRRDYFSNQLKAEIGPFMFVRSSSKHRLSAPVTMFEPAVSLP